MKTLYLVKVIGHDRPTMVFPDPRDGTDNEAVFRHITNGRNTVPDSEWKNEYSVVAALHNLALEWRIQA